jgi:hypothetical protein
LSSVEQGQKPPAVTSLLAAAAEDAVLAAVSFSIVTSVSTCRDAAVDTEAIVFTLRALLAFDFWLSALEAAVYGIFADLRLRFGRHGEEDAAAQRIDSLTRLRCWNCGERW